jgi:hypothetical protein
MLFGEIASDWNEPLKESGLCDLARLVDGAVGTACKQKPSSAVYRLRLANGELLYLKRYDGPDIGRVLKRLLRFRLPTTAALEEYRTAKLLGSRGIAVMEPIAWGERRRLGVWPLRGFVLVREVRGVEVHDSLLAESAESARCAVLHSAGKVLGRLHSLGYFRTVRLKDMIQTDRQAEAAPAEVPITLIDLDIKGARAPLEPFHMDRCTDGVVKVCYAFLRGHQRLRSVREARAFMHGYRESLRAEGHALPRGFWRGVAALLDRRLAEHAASASLSSSYPGLPRSVRQWGKSWHD